MSIAIQSEYAGMSHYRRYIRAKRIAMIKETIAISLTLAFFVIALLAFALVLK